MRTLAVVVMCLLSACHSFEGGGHALVSGPTSLIEAWRHAFLDRDVDAMVACYEAGGASTLMHSTGQVLIGSRAIRTDYETAFASTVFDDVTIDLGDLVVEGDVAWVTGRLRMLTRPSVGDARWKLEINTTFVMRRSGQHWRIAHEQSTPVQGVPRVQDRS